MHFCLILSFLWCGKQEKTNFVLDVYLLDDPVDLLMFIVPKLDSKG